MNALTKYCWSSISLLLLPFIITAQVEIGVFSSPPELSSLVFYENKIYAPHEHQPKISIIENNKVVSSIDYQFDTKPSRRVDIEGIATIENTFLLLDEANACIYTFNATQKTVTVKTQKLALDKADSNSEYGLEGITVNPAQNKLYLVRENVKGNSLQAVVYQYNYQLNAVKDELTSLNLVDSTIIQFPRSFRAADIYFHNAKLYCLATNKEDKEYALFDFEMNVVTGGLKNRNQETVYPKSMLDFSVSNVNNFNYEGLTMINGRFTTIADAGSQIQTAFLLELQEGVNMKRI